MPRPLVKPEIPSGDGEARRKPLHVPLERSRQRLVEIIDAEHQATIRGGEDPEIREMRVATQLSVESRSGAVREVGGHDVGRATVESERRDEHPPVANRDQLREACLRLLLEQLHRVAADRGGLPVSMRRTRYLRPGSLSARPPLGNGEATARPRIDVRAETFTRPTDLRVGADHDSASLAERLRANCRPKWVNSEATVCWLGRSSLAHQANRVFDQERWGVPCSLQGMTILSSA